MCTPKKLLDRRRAFLSALRSDQPIKIRPPTRHATDLELQDAAGEIFEKYARLLRKPRGGKRWATDCGPLAPMERAIRSSLFPTGFVQL